jgi:uncharacterized protein
MKNKTQIIFIHGGIPLKTKNDFYKYLKTTKIAPFKERRRWGDFLQGSLNKKYEVIKPIMPSKYEADYKAWKIWFERHFSFITNKNFILIGHSLGGTFLLKYLSENKFPKKIKQLHLVAPATIDKDLRSFKFDVNKIYKIPNFCEDIYLWHSKDDKEVSLENSEVVKKIIPSAYLCVFKDRGHFIGKSFPEIIKVIKSFK